MDIDAPTSLSLTADLRRLLYVYFSSYGKVLDVVALKSQKMRGQAFIVFKDLATSTTALRKEDGRVFAGKAMRISYAKGKSFATIQNESGKEALYQLRMGIVKNPDASKRLTVSGAQAALSSTTSTKRPNGTADDEGQDTENKAAKRQKTDGDAADEEEEDDMMVESDDE